MSIRIAPAPIGKVTFPCRSFRVPSHYTARLPIRKKKVSFNQRNKNTGHRIPYLKVDAETGDEVEAAGIIKGYQVDKDTYVQVGKEELDAIAMESTRTIEIDEFVHQDDIDSRYLIRPYYLVPDGKVGYDSIRCDPCDDCEDGDGQSVESFLRTASAALLATCEMLQNFTTVRIPSTNASFSGTPGMPFVGFVAPPPG
jgi:hypothetical protein